MGLPLGRRVWVAAGVTDMRKGMDGLAALVETALDERAFSLLLPNQAQQPRILDVPVRKRSLEPLAIPLGATLRTSHVTCAGPVLVQLDELVDLLTLADAHLCCDSHPPERNLSYDSPQNRGNSQINPKQSLNNANGHPRA